MTDQKHKVALFIAGPTASGKSGLAMAVADQLAQQDQPAWIINADSMQVYADLRILTARPPAADETRHSHHLYGFRSMNQPCSAPEWAELASVKIDKAIAAGAFPILVGGTGLYFRTLLEGIAAIPDISDAVRGEVLALPKDQLHSVLRLEDPVMADRLNPGDSQRLARALMVVRETGDSLAVWQDRGGEQDWPGNAIKIALTPDRDWLYDRCDARFDQMLTQGVMEEVQAVGGKGYDPNLPGMKSLGLPELLQAHAGTIPLEDAVTASKTATRRYAKRQLTWIRNQMSDWTKISQNVENEQHLERISCDILTKIDEMLLR